MASKKGSRTDVTTLRDRAEKLLSISPRDINAEDYKNIQTLIHELSVYQIELEMQNENLRRTQVELQAQHDKYLELYNTIPIAHMTVNNEGLVLEANNTTFTMFSAKKRDLVDSSITHLITPESQDAFYLLSKRVCKTGEKQGCELILRKLNDENFPAYLESAAISDSDGIIRSQRIAITDITEHKLLEEERQRADKLESIGTLAGGIAHDFNNLLAGILGNISLARRHIELGCKASEMLEEAEKATIRARDLTEQLLTFARGGAPVKKLSSIAEIIKESAAFALRGSSARLELSFPANLWAAEVDEGQISQVISNLVINADEAMPSGGTIHISAQNMFIDSSGSPLLPEGNYILIEIQDEGIGMSKEQITRMFEPYYTTKQKGHGLGLSTAYSIIKKHRGLITAKSAIQAGTTFYIYLPACDKPTPREEAIVKKPARGKGKVLVMDDEEIIRNMLKKMLPRAGYQVELTRDGAEAIEKYAEAMKAGKPFDAVIMDLTIPGGMGGKEAVMRLLEIDPGAKVIVSSGYATDPTMSDYKEYGFSAVITKPYSVSDIEKTLRNLLKITELFR